MIWRLADIVAATVGILIFFPLYLLGFVMVLFDDGFPIFYRQERLGRGGKGFGLLKFRTMYKDAHKKGLITVGGRDPRVTKSGYFLRKSKLDELPQLFNVLKGDMSLVGPRPEVKRYVDIYPADFEYLLKVRPGISSPASIAFSNENEILSNQKNPEKFYQEVVLPEKIALDKSCVDNRSMGKYFSVIFKTIGKVVSGNKN